MEPNQPQNVQAPTEQPSAATPSPTPAPPPQTPNNKKLIIGIAIGLGVLLFVLIALVIVLITQRSNNMSGNQQSNSSQSANDQSGTETRKVAKTVVLAGNASLQVTIYEPRQTGTNTTIDYTIKNICTSSCKSQEYANGYNIGVSNDGSAYLLDAESGTKFNPIIDNNNNPVATESCSAFLVEGESLDCFAAFTKVPDGTTFSFVTRGLKVDGLKAE